MLLNYLKLFTFNFYKLKIKIIFQSHQVKSIFIINLLYKFYKCFRFYNGNNICIKILIEHFSQFILQLSISSSNIFAQKKYWKYFQDFNFFFLKNTENVLLIFLVENFRQIITEFLHIFSMTVEKFKQNILIFDRKIQSNLFSRYLFPKYVPPSP